MGVFFITFMFYTGEDGEVDKRVRIVFKVNRMNRVFCDVRGSWMKTINLPQGCHMSQCWLGLKQASLLDP